ncbi:MAG TPA: competence protein ComEA [Eubacterium sp.]|nr:competence protein ComEA [Eubacterium sp.]
MDLYSLKRFVARYKLYITIILILICGYVYVSGHDKTESEELKKDVVTSTAHAFHEEEKTITVYIDGAVTTPGVYIVAEDTRLYMLFEKAGGLCEDADIGNLNPASLLKDGQKITVRKIGDIEDIDESDALIDINHANKDELSALPGIGQSRALDIINYRNEHGPFVTIEDIMNVSGIKENTYNKIKDLIKVN